MRVQKLSPRRWPHGRAGRAATAALLGAVGVALLAWLVVIPATRVQAATFTVNAASDEGDDNIGDGQCHTAGGQCTLRAAIEEANASPGQDVIAIGVTGPIVLNSGLPTIADDDLVITGSGQQVNLTAPGTAFSINADGVQINNLVVDGANVGDTGIKISATTDDLVLGGLTVRRFVDDGFSNTGGGQRNHIGNCTFTANGEDGIGFAGGKDDVVRDSVITSNARSGLAVINDDNFLAQGNTFSDNTKAQIDIPSMLAGQHISIIQNTITSGSDGIVIGAGADSTAHIDIGLSVDNRNVFRGNITAPAEQYLRDLGAVNVNAIYNDWNAYTVAGIEGLICHHTDPGCGPGVVNFEPFIDTPSPLATATPTSTPTQTPGGPTVTPTVTTTPTPGGVEAVPLIAGCNPVAWTGSDGTPAATIASAVTPPGILVALWNLSLAGVWQGYSPQFPEASDLQSIDRLGVVFVCDNAAGTFSRPVI